jgi:hypothetical protein
VADQTYVLVDSSKYGHNCLTSFARLRDVELTITDGRLPRSQAKKLEAAGAKLRIADVTKAGLNRAGGASDASTSSQTSSRNNDLPLQRKGKR